MDVRYINPFIAAAQHVFKTMLKTEVIVGRPFLREKGAPPADVSAVIAFSGDATGAVALCFPKGTATKVASTFAGADISPTHEDFPDALGELANMVAGQAKAQFGDLHVTVSLPSVVLGRPHSAFKSGHQPTLVLPCDSALGRFSVEVVMVVEERRPHPAAAPD